ncbi:MAG: RdgB/HAM1 family non-canonical purine NTP pyrophosphatase, partial [Lachnospiraceae bacterium]|nr:RdgB/HAM1 family non-canonical purine NTP pyrophosphatase [Lachnospiraceae bacterium]
RNLDADILSMKDAGIETDIVEDGATFEENAVIKAKAVAALLTEHDGGKYRDAIVLADDSGLEIDYLNKEPGIYSARYMGEHTPYSAKNQNLLKRLAGVPAEKRSARFVCAIAAVIPGGDVITTLGTIEGRIGDRAEGNNGFGYDPIFYVPEFGCTTAQLSEEEKNRISHRGRALEAMEAELKKKL